MRFIGLTDRDFPIYDSPKWRVKGTLLCRKCITQLCIITLVHFVPFIALVICQDSLGQNRTIQSLQNIFFRLQIIIKRCGGGVIYLFFNKVFLAFKIMEKNLTLLMGTGPSQKKLQQSPLAHFTWVLKTPMSDTT